MTPTKMIDRTRAAWGESLPDWIEVLATACDRESQKAISRKLGYSAATISYVLANKYPGDLKTVEQTVRGHLMSATVECPVIGVMSTSSCVEQQKAEWSSRRAMLHAACRAGCPHSRLINGGSNAE